MQRKIISITALFSFILLIASSLALYLLLGKPRGIPAFFWGVHLSTWRALHTTGGVFFILIGIWHVIINKKFLARYLLIKNKDFLAIMISIGLILFVYVGTILDWEPMNTILSIARHRGRYY